MTPTPDPLRYEFGFRIDEDDFALDGTDPLLEMAAKAHAICRKPKGHDAQPAPALDAKRLHQAMVNIGILRTGRYYVARIADEYADLAESQVEQP